MKFYVVINYYLVSLSFNFHKDPTLIIHWDYNKHYSQHYHGDNRREAGKYFYTILFNIWKSLFARTLSANSNLFNRKNAQVGGTEKLTRGRGEVEKHTRGRDRETHKGRGGEKHREVMRKYQRGV